MDTYGALEDEMDATKTITITNVKRPDDVDDEEEEDDSDCKRAITTTDDDKAQQFAKRVRRYVEDLKQKRHRVARGGVWYIKIVKFDYQGCECFPYASNVDDMNYGAIAYDVPLHGMTPMWSFREWAKAMTALVPQVIRHGYYKSKHLRFSTYYDKWSVLKLCVILEP